MRMPHRDEFLGEGIFLFESSEIPLSGMHSWCQEEQAEHPAKKLSKNWKKKETDLLYETSDYLINIEGNSEYSNAVNVKNMSYVLALLLRQLKPGENNKIKKVLQININNENPLNNGEFMGVSLFTDVLSGKVRYEDAIVVD